MKSRTTRNIQIEKPAEPRVAEGRRRRESVRRQGDGREEGEESDEEGNEITVDIIKTRLLDPALGEWDSRRRTRRAVRPSSFRHLLKVTGTIYRNRGASLDMDPL